MRFAVLTLTILSVSFAFGTRAFAELEGSANGDSGATAPATAAAPADGAQANPDPNNQKPDNQKATQEFTVLAPNMCISGDCYKDKTHGDSNTCNVGKGAAPGQETCNNWAGTQAADSATSGKKTR